MADRCDADLTPVKGGKPVFCAGLLEEVASIGGEVLARRCSRCQRLACPFCKRPNRHRGRCR